RWKTLTFNQIFDLPPMLLADMQTTNGGDTAGLLFRNLDEDSVDFFVQEEKSANDEVRHINETVGYIAIERPHELVAKLNIWPNSDGETVIQGKEDVRFLALVFDATQSDIDIFLSEVRVKVNTSEIPPVSPDVVSNFGIYVDDNRIETTNDPDELVSIANTPGESALVIFHFDNTTEKKLEILAGQEKVAYIKANVSPRASEGIYRVGPSESLANSVVTAHPDVIPGMPVELSIEHSDGPEMTFVQSGELTINIDSSTPKAGLIPANSTGLTAAVYNTFALYEDINIEKMYITATQVNSGGLDQISMFHIYDGGTLLASVEPTSTDAAARTVLVDITNTPIVVPRDTSKKLTIKVDTSDVDYELGSLGAAGEGFSFIITAAGDVTAKGAQSGKTISTKNVDSTASKGMTLFKSVPVVATNDLLTSGKIASGALASGTDNDKSLYAFSVTADSAGDVALHHVMFRIATTTATVTNFKLTDGSENVAFGPTGDVGLLWMNESSAQAQAGEGSIVMVFTDDQIAPSGVTADPDDNIVPYTIPAGETRTFTLIGDVACLSAGASSCSGTGSGSVNIQMLGDVATPGTNPTDAFTAVDTFEELLINSFYWSDL
ncbi:MAG: hypothetical protein QF535_15085, partial [Anaerolineales bacterium]|nr:hypothetical protein [Anaerolineales bacterium]